MFILLVSVGFPRTALNRARNPGYCENPIEHGQGYVLLWCIYVHRWKHFEECSFLDVIVSNHTTFSIVQSCESPSTPSSSSTGDLDEADHETSPQAATISQQPRKKKRNAQRMDTKASALSELAKGAASSSKEDDEWDIFGRDVANSIRAIKSEDLRRRAKFAVQTAIFQTTEHASL